MKDLFDFFRVFDLLTPEERRLHTHVRQFVDDEIMPYIKTWWDNESTPVREIMRKMGASGLLGPTVPKKYGGQELSDAAYGLICYEIERGDSGLRSMLSVQGSLVMYPILAFGTEEQKQHWLPRLASGEAIGCFGLTEAEGGSDPAAMQTVARRDGEYYVLDGAKTWITNSTEADVALVWAKTFEEDKTLREGADGEKADGEKIADGTVRGFLVPTDTQGFSAPPIEHKMSLRAAPTGQIVLHNCRIPASNVLPLSQGLKTPLNCLSQARYGIAWGVMGALEAVLQATLDYTGQRQTFGEPLARRQLVQDKLVKMASEHSLGLLMAWRLASLKQTGAMNFAQVSMAKRNNVRVALEAARLARELHGANGVSTEYAVIRHMLNLETVDTYEGTHDIHTLIVGRHLTKLSAL